MGSLLTSTSSLGFPGGSLGRLGTGWLGFVIVGILGHNLDLVVKTTYLASACCNDGSVTSVCIWLSFSLYELLYDLLCRRVCDVPVVPQVLISLLCIDSYASV